MAKETTEARKIRIRGFTYYKEVPHPSTPGEFIIQAAFATRGQTVELNEADIARGESINAFEVEGDEESQTPADFDLVEASDDEIDEYLENESPNIKETLALVPSGDKESAERLKEAEERVTGGAPRQGVIDGLDKIIDE